MSDSVRIPPSTLIEFARDVLHAGGATADEADVVARSLVEANLRGHDSHGVFRVMDYVGQMRRGEVVPGVASRILDEGPARIVADGARGFGQVQCRRLLERLIPKTREQGLACGTIRQSGHVGRLGEWVELAARDGLGAMLAVNDNGVPQTVAPPGGLSPRISTNPIALGVPAPGEPLVLDISTSAVANGKVTVARMAGKECPPGWLQDAAGNPTTDPNVLKADPPGALLPFGGDQGYKAFGLAVLLDVLVSGLTGGFCPPAPAGTVEHNNILLVLWDPDRWAGRSHFLEEARRLTESLRDTPTKDGRGVRLPGDGSALTKRERLETGIPVAAGTWEELERFAEGLGVRG